jgi:hypothetical protein
VIIQNVTNKNLHIPNDLVTLTRRATLKYDQTQYYQVENFQKTCDAVFGL